MPAVVGPASQQQQECPPRSKPRLQSKAACANNTPQSVSQSGYRLQGLQTSARPTNISAEFQLKAVYQEPATNMGTNDVVTSENSSGGHPHSSIPALQQSEALMIPVMLQNQYPSYITVQQPNDHKGSHAGQPQLDKAVTFETDMDESESPNFAGNGWFSTPWTYEEDTQAPQVGWRAKLSKLVDTVLDSMTLAVLLDLADVGIYFLDIITDIRVLQAFSNAGYTKWLYLSVWFITWHYVIMAVLLVGAVRRAAGKWGAYEYAERSSGNRQRSPLWVLSIPFALPGVVALDLMMICTSVLPLLVRQRGSGSGMSSFLSNYNFTRLFLEFVCESVPQTVLQTYIVSRLISSNLATSMDITTIAFSLFISSFNVVKYSWKFRKAARQAGMNFMEYSKYVLLLKGNFECAPTVLAEQIAACSRLQDGQLLLDGFVLHRQKNTFGPAQQAFILMRSLKALESRRDVTEFVVSGCPLPCVNRLLQIGLAQFPCLQLLELRESAFRGNTWRGVLEALQIHPSCRRLRVVQTGVFARYKNFNKEAITESFKPKYRLKHIGLCIPWWDAAMTAAAARNAARPLAIQNTAAAAAKAKLYQAATAVAAALPAPRSYKHIMRRAFGRLGDHAAPHDSAGGNGSSSMATSEGVDGIKSGDGSGAGEGLVVLALEYPRPSGSKGLSGAELKFLSKYSPCEVDLSACTSIAGLITHSSSLTSLALHHQVLHPLGLSCMAIAAGRSSSLTSLSLRGSNVGDQGAIELARLLSSCPCLATLNLRGCGLHQEGGSALAAALPQARQLIKLDLSANRLAGPRCVASLASGLRLSAGGSAGGLHKLLLEEVDDLGEQVDGLAALCAALSCNSQLSSLSLASSGISGPCLAAMAGAGLAAAAGLAVIDVSIADGKRHFSSTSRRPTENGMHHPSTYPRFCTAPAFTTDATTDLCNTSDEETQDFEAAAEEGEGDAGAGIVRLSYAWLNATNPNSTCLQELNLKGHPLPQPAVVALAQVLQHVKLRVLKLSDPFGLGEQQLAVLCPAVAAAPALQQLELLHCGTGMGSRGPLGLCAARAIAHMISAPGCHLASLDLSFGSFKQDTDESDAIWSVLAGALACSRRSRQRSSPVRCSASRAASASLVDAQGVNVACRTPSQRQIRQHSCGGCRLVHLSLAHCGVHDSGAAAFAAALSSNVGLVTLDLSGLRQQVANVAFGELLRSCSAAVYATQSTISGPALQSRHATAHSVSVPLLATAAADRSVKGGVAAFAAGCILRSLKVTGEQFDVVDMLAPLRQALLQQAAMTEWQQQQLHRSQQQERQLDAAVEILPAAQDAALL